MRKNPTRADGGVNLPWRDWLRKQQQREWIPAENLWRTQRRNDRDDSRPYTVTEKQQCYRNHCQEQDSVRI